MSMKTVQSVIADFPEDVRNNYDFSKAIYNGATVPINGIVCSKHGVFSQYSGNLRKGTSCAQCGAEKRIASQRLGNDGFIAKAKEVHGDMYLYDKTNYVTMKQKVTVTCKQHGDFEISPIKHTYSAQGCPECGAMKRGKRKTSKNVGAAAAKTSIVKHAAAFEKKSKLVHGNKYDYSKVVYIGAKTPVLIGCPKHGDFLTGPWDHINKGYGCPQCSHHLSKAENEVHRFLSNFTSAEQRNRRIIRPKELDIYLPEHNLGVEYCGMYWHSHVDQEDERTNKRRHYEKYKLCQEKGVRLLTVYESEWQNNQYAVKRLLRNAIGKSRARLMARKCDLRKATAQEAREFYNKYHPQGGNGSGEHYALLWKGKIVACMRFTLGANDRGHSAKTRDWTLTRYATRITVSGGASRLFNAFVNEHNPESVKSFSDNRYFEGGMYTQLGFDLEEEVGPDYQVWSQKSGLRPKSHYQRRLLPARLAEHGMTEQFDPETDQRTEAEMTYLMGARRIYDCGKKRWVWTP